MARIEAQATRAFFLPKMQKQLTSEIPRVLSGLLRGFNCQTALPPPAQASGSRASGRGHIGEGVTIKAAHITISARLWKSQYFPGKAGREEAHLARDILL